RVVVSTAIETTNPDIQAAQTLHIPIVHRAEELSQAIPADHLLAICGTSGKSTTTALTAWLLLAAQELHCFVGGAELLDNTPGGLGWTAVHVGQGRWSCLELDESDRSLLRFAPRHTLILNITQDHHPYEECLALFQQFCAQVTGEFFLNQADPGCQALGQRLDASRVYWFTPPLPEAITQTTEGIAFPYKDRTLYLPLMGVHNAENATGALTMLERVLGSASLDTLSHALQGFPGIRRRMQRAGTSRVPVYDDYAHNPEKVHAAITALQTRFARVWILFQPHGYGPLRFHLDAFAQTFSQTLRQQDHLVLLPVYDAGGTTDRGITSGDLAAQIQTRNPVSVLSRDDILATLPTQVQPGDAILVAGARDDTLTTFADHIADFLAETK
ncbi:MAG: cyanophycin synthetase, partial [bacterium]|nr:cyanophycin synthetase [bacterium]